MVLFNYSTRELTAKIVYYGPGLCGKTTNLQFVYEQLPEDVKGKMLSLATKTDRTLFFDFLPMDLGDIRGMKTRVQLYTVPGQVFYNETRKLVLKGADGVVFVADSQEQMMASNVESLRNLEENLKAHGMKLSEIPHVLQFNKRDLPRVCSVDEINANLNKYNCPCFEAVATTGIGVQDTLKGIARLVLVNLTRRYQPKAAPTPGASAPAATAEPEVPPAKATSASKLQPAMDTAKAKGAGIPLSPMSAESAASATRARASAPAKAASAARPTPAETGLASFGEVEIEEMVGGLREDDSVGDLSSDGESWDAGAGSAFEASSDDGFFLGEAEAEIDTGSTSFGRSSSGTAVATEPTVDVTRLTTNESREITVPVELKDGKAVRRFRLSIKLRLDPVD